VPVPLTAHECKTREKELIIDKEKKKQRHKERLNSQHCLNSKDSPPSLKELGEFTSPHFFVSNHTHILFVDVIMVVENLGDLVRLHWEL